MPGAGDEGMGPNIASIQSLLNATQARTAGGSPEEGDDKSVLAVMSAVMATPTEALKADMPGNLTGNIEKAVTSLGANLTTQLSIYSASKGTSLFFGFPELIGSMQGGEDGVGGGFDGGGDEIAGGGLMGDDNLLESGDPTMHGHDPWSFDQYPTADETIGHAASGLGGVSHVDEDHGYGHHHDISPSPSPNLIDTGEGRGM